MMKYDLIGDIHGHADALTSLLEKLDYRILDGCYRHESRKAIFLGDFIDRGPDQRGVLQTVMPMVQNKAALAVMGNHEFNALAFHTQDPEKLGTWLRPRKDKNVYQHLAFLSEYLRADMDTELEAVLEFFYSLPLWLDLDGLRVIHAAWHSSSIDIVKAALGGKNIMDKAFLVAASKKGTDEYAAVEILLKGVEHTLPSGLSHRDKDGNERTEVRTWFFQKGLNKLKDIIVHPDQFDDEILNIPVSSEVLSGYDESEPPVFVGHYWMKKDEAKHPAKLRENVACLDYSVAKGGYLVAYRWSGEQEIDNSNFVY